VEEITNGDVIAASYLNILFNCSGDPMPDIDGSSLSVACDIILMVNLFGACG